MSDLARTETVPPTPYVQNMQIGAWAEYGGQDLMDGLIDVFDEMTATLTEGQDQGLDAGRLRWQCKEAAQIAAEAHRYFAIPDAEAQASWETALEQIEAVGSLCVTAIDTHNDALFARALSELAAATDSLSAAFTRLEVLLIVGSE